MDASAVFVATCLAAAIGSMAMGLISNYPLALAPGMGINAFFTFGIVMGMGISWQQALGAVFISGIFLISSINLTLPDPPENKVTLIVFFRDILEFSNF